ncbi:MAG TPA: M28 family peptidase, partial [Telluria sp.]|nr:M28 family peptidase [Telluria sp.]
MYTDKTLLEQSSVAGIATTIVSLALLGWIALRSAPLPAPTPADAPPASFSAARAFAQIEALAQTPRQTGSAANAQARNYLLGQLRTLGFEAHVQTATAQRTRVDSWENAQATVAVVNNIVARKRGSSADRATRPALLLAMHYDSAPTSLGASDGAPVAAALETLRALQSLPPLQNDLIVLFTDGERAGALGARAFVDEHPWAREVGMVLQFASGGTRGPQMLYDTRGGNGAAVGGWARAVPLPRGTSLMHEVHALKDAGPLKRLGQSALVFSSIEGAPDDLGSLDTPERLDRASLQHLGDTMLGMVRHFGMQPLAAGARDDHVYFELPFIGLVHYPASWIWPLTRLACLLFVGVYCLARQRGGIEPRDVVRGALSFALIAGPMAFAAYFVWQAFPGLHPGYNPGVQGAGTHDNWYLLAFGALGGALFIGIQRKVQEIIGVPAAALGALLAMTLALPLVSWWMPGASYLLSWPLFGALFAFAMLYVQPAGARSQRARVALLVAGLAPAVLLIVPAVRDVYTLFTPDSMNLPIALLALLLGFGVALLSTMQRRYVVRTLGLACAGFLLVARTPQPYGEAPPHPNRL